MFPVDGCEIPISHQVETMGNHLLLIIYRRIIVLGFLGCRILSIHSMSNYS